MLDVEEIFREFEGECLAHRDYKLPIYVDARTALAVIGGLQLSLRHPANRGPIAEITRTLIDAMIARLLSDGFVAGASLAALGDDPRYDG